MITTFRFIARLLYLGSLILTLHCSRTSTDELLTADFATRGQTPIDLLAPKDGSSVDATPVLSWSQRSGVSLYLVEVSASADFTTLVAGIEVSGSTYKLMPSDVVGGQGLKSVRYYWRVSAARVATTLRSSVSSFNVFSSDIIYVDANSTATTQIGNITAPLKTIQGALELADSGRNGDAGVTKRIFVAQGTYTESVTLKPGISLYGGYATGSEFATRNTTQNVSTIQAPAMIAVQGLSNITTAFTGTTVIDGFRVVGGAVSGTVNAGFFLTSSNPTISNNVIVGGSAGTPYGIRSDSSSPVISGNTISGGSTAALSSSSFGIHCIAGSPQISGNTISGGVAFNTNGISIVSGSAASITGNNIRGGTGTINSYGIVNNTAAPAEIRGNIIHGGSATSSYGIKTDISSPPVTNNIIMGGTGDNSYAVWNGQASPILSNNLIIASGYDLSYGVFLTTATSTSRVTNNIFVGGGQYRELFRENDNNPDPRAFENNAFWDSWGAGGTLYQSEGGTPISTIAGIEALTDWGGGQDKARGNILLTAGASGNPFVNFPVFLDATSASNVGASTILRIDDGRCAAGPYVNGQYIEWNGDGIARQITCNGATVPDEITITPPLTDANANLSRVEIRYWGTKSQGGSQYLIDYQLQQNALTLQAYNNLRYGGKNTSGNNCGAPSGGPATGAGGEACGNVTTDRLGNARTTANAGQANNNTVPNGSGGATAAVPGGFSIGPHERD